MIRMVSIANRRMSINEAVITKVTVRSVVSLLLLVTVGLTLLAIELLLVEISLLVGFLGVGLLSLVMSLEIKCDDAREIECNDAREIECDDAREIECDDARLLISITIEVDIIVPEIAVNVVVSFDTGFSVTVIERTELSVGTVNRTTHYKIYTYNENGHTIGC